MGTVQRLNIQLMDKWELFNVLIKEMKINERKKSLELDFQKETKGRR